MGERERSGLVDDGSLVQKFKQAAMAGWFDGQHEQAAFQSGGFCLGIIHGGMVLPDGAQRPAVTTPVRIQDPGFCTRLPDWAGLVFQ